MKTGCEKRAGMSRGKKTGKGRIFRKILLAAVLTALFKRFRGGGKKPHRILFMNF